MKDISETLTKAEVSKVLRLGDQAVKEIPPSELPYFQANGRGDRRYRLADLLRYIEKRTVR